MFVNRILIVILLLPLLAGCGGHMGQPNTSVSLKQARIGFVTKIVRSSSDREPVEKPPAGVFSIVQYKAPQGKLPAYLTPDPRNGKKYPAIIWITGGDCNSIGSVWEQAPKDNDQTASAFRESGIVMMFPSLRGGNENPGKVEGFMGEVNDILAAADFLEKQPYVDPKRIYLGGHSTGGTLSLLTAEYSGRFRAVFTFGPVEDVSGYGEKYCPFDLSNQKEIDLRAPGLWLHSISSPVFVFEGTAEGNVSSLESMASSSKNPKVKFFPIKGATHFSTLYPTTHLIAAKILKDTGANCNIIFSKDELNKPFAK